MSIRSAEPLEDFWVRLTLTDGSHVERNVLALLGGPVFETIRADDSHFRQVRVRHGTLEWPGELDLDPNVLIWNGPRPRDTDARPAPRLTLTHPTAIARAR
ncbi:MAG: hypothetical protein A2Z32_07295 [Chloroflexi bacterium RBG_16_69_14]|nr:MAG: hypothetical protein A2Z32_07295 [Chloroflexi bacterium RBG_16_69_14]